MGVYSSIDVYPKWIDEIDTSECENCDIPCDKLGYCPFDEE